MKISQGIYLIDYWVPKKWLYKHYMAGSPQFEPLPYSPILFTCMFSFCSLLCMQNILKTFENIEVAMLTLGQNKALEFIKHYIAHKGFAPSLAEIAEGLGTSSRGSMHKQVQALAKAGVIRLLPGRQRGSELTEDPDNRLDSLHL